MMYVCVYIYIYKSPRPVTGIAFFWGGGGQVFIVCNVSFIPCVALCLFKHDVLIWVICIFLSAVLLYTTTV
jgi:hypothetical protein